MLSINLSHKNIRSELHIFYTSIDLIHLWAKSNNLSFSFKPPPPGCAPNAAQMAQMQGHNVVVTQQKGNFLTGGSDGGYTIW